MNAAALALLLLVPQAGSVDLDKILQTADKLLEEAKAAYEAAKSGGKSSAFVDAGFKLEEARIKYLVLQEVGGPDRMKIAAERLRAVNQLTKLINDGKAAAGGPRGEKPAEGPESEPAVKPPAEPEKAPDVLKRHPMPEAAQIKEAEKQVRDLFNDLYAKKSHDDRVALARALLALCAKEGNDPPALYFMYGEAVEICIQLCDPLSAIVVVDRFARIFDIDIVAARYGAVSSCAANAKTVEHSDDLADALVIVAEDLAGADLYDLAEKCATSGLTHARKASNPVLIPRLTTRIKEFAEAKARYAAMKGVLETLAKSKEDPAANLQMGQFLCYVKGSWDMGIRFLARGSDPALKLLAEKEIALPDPADRLVVADGWWDLGDKEKSPLRKAQLLSHAREVYESVLSGLSALQQARIEKRLGELDVATATPVNLLKMITLPGDSVRAEATKEGRYLVYGVPDWGRLTVPFVPPEEYDLTVVVERRTPDGQFNVVLSNGKSQVIVVLDGGGRGDLAGFDQIEGKGFPGNETTFRGKLLPVGARSVVSCMVRKNRISVTVNGKKIIDYKGAFKRLNLHGGYAMPQPTTLGLGGWGGKYLVSLMALSPVGGQGSKLR